MTRSVASWSGVLSAVVLMVGNVGQAWAHTEEQASRWGEGADRLCNVVVDSDGEVVVQTGGEGAVIQQNTYDCPEEVAAVEPAAPPAPLVEPVTVYFAFDKADLDGEAQAKIGELAAEIEGREVDQVSVVGHTDTAGPANYNETLSQQRANTVASELVKGGIPASVIATEALGETELAVETPDGVPNAANRRAVIDFAR